MENINQLSSASNSAFTLHKALTLGSSHKLNFTTTKNTVLHSTRNTNSKKRHYSSKSKDQEQPWTELEEVTMLIAHQRHQNKWANIAETLHGRSNNSIKNRFYSMFRRVKNKARKMDFSYGSRLELHEAFYMMELMEQYFDNPLPAAESSGKRGKDFLYSLLKGIDIGTVKRYKGELSKYSVNRFTLEELWLELADREAEIKSSRPKKLEQIEHRNIVPSLNHLNSHNECFYLLPHPNNFYNSCALTQEEKTFIISQTFQKREHGKNCQTQLMTGLPYSSPTLFSAGYLSTATPFEGFSEFTSLMCCPQIAYSKDSSNIENAISVMKGSNDVQEVM